MRYHILVEAPTSLVANIQAGWCKLDSSNDAAQIKLEDNSTQRKRMNLQSHKHTGRMTASKDVYACGQTKYVGGCKQATSCMTWLVSFNVHLFFAAMAVLNDCNHLSLVHLQQHACDFPSLVRLHFSDQGVQFLTCCATGTINVNLHAHADASHNTREHVD